MSGRKILTPSELDSGKRPDWLLDDFSHPLLKDYNIIIASYMESVCSYEGNMRDNPPLIVRPIPAVICGHTNQFNFHAIAWDGERCYDPMTKDPFDGYDPSEIFDHLCEVNYVFLPPDWSLTEYTVDS